jgi:phosphate transport system substrate-binding protein
MLAQLAGQTPQSSGPARRLYVEPFTTKEGAAELRDDVVSDLRKTGGVSLAASAADADVILGGGGEVWVRGYRSLNPRSGRLPSDGSPVYGGYLSVELRDSKGQTLWSYLATPGIGPEDVPKSLSKQIAKHVSEALAQDAAPAATFPSQPRAILKGAGATFPYPVYQKWFTNYRLANPEVEITYDPVGSEAGVRRLLAGDVDFAGSEDPNALKKLAPGKEGKYLLFPSAVGAVVPIVNLPGITSDISFTPEILAGIYLGRITKWNDAALRRANLHIRLPALDIVIVHRSDGSGTSYAFTDFLSQTSPQWKEQVGASLTPRWPVGRQAAGNEGVSATVKELGGSIGYVEYIYALQKHLSFGKVRNAEGEFVGASLESIGVAAKKAMEISDDLKVSLANAPGAGAYPISSFTWLVIPAHVADETKRNAASGFLTWMLGPGQKQAAALGYLPLPKDLIDREKSALLTIH